MPSTVRDSARFQPEAILKEVIIDEIAWRTVVHRQSAFRFGDFVIDIHARELSRAGDSVQLVGNPFDVLAYLIVHHGRVVPGMEIFEAVWDSNSGNRVYDPQYVQQAISTIRAVLGDNPQAPKYVATYRARGFRFIAPLVEPATSEDTTSTRREATSNIRAHSKAKLPTLLVGIVSLIAVAGILIASLYPTVPHVLDSAPITHDGLAKYAPLLSDEENAYFTEVVSGRYRMMKVNIRSKETTTIPSSLTNPYLCDLSGDSKRLLVRSVVGGFDDYGPLFIQGVDGKGVAALPITAFDAAWAPDGRSLVYARGSEVSLYDFAARTSRVVARVQGYAWWPRLRPDSRLIRFTVSDAQSQLTSLWEVRKDGNGLRQLFGSKDPWFHAGCGSWTPDGNLFFFQVGRLSNYSQGLRP